MFGKKERGIWVIGERAVASLLRHHSINTERTVATRRNVKKQEAVSHCELAFVMPKTWTARNLAFVNWSLIGRGSFKSLTNTLIRSLRPSQARLTPRTIQGKTSVVVLKGCANRQ
jgi:hypothetical protein